jgi:hypothetical protein
VRRWLLIAAVAALTALSAVPTNPTVSREDLAFLERVFDSRIASYNPNDPFHLLGNTRGFYLEDYGVLFSSELNLVAAAVVTPFRPRYTPEQLEELRNKKITRLAELKNMMQTQMVDSALRLKSVPPEQRVAVGVSIFRFGWEDSRGIPSQVLMEARRQALLDFESGKLDAEGLKQAIRLQEF